MKDRDRWDILRDYRELRKILGDASIVVETVVYPCEDINKVNKALDAVLNGKSEEEQFGDYIILLRKSSDPDDITKIFNVFRRRKILAAVRRYAKKYSSDSEVVIYLNKQSAYAGVLNICEPGESPLGEIIIRIKSNRAIDLLNKMTKF